MTEDDRVSLRDYVEALLKERDKAIEIALESVREGSRRRNEWMTTLIAVGAALISLGTAILVFLHR